MIAYPFHCHETSFGTNPQTNANKQPSIVPAATQAEVIGGGEQNTENNPEVYY